MTKPRANYTDWLLGLIRELHLDPLYSKDFIEATRFFSNARAMEVIKTHAKRLTKYDLSTGRILLIYDKSVINYKTEINNTGVDMTDLNQIFDTLKNDSVLEVAFARAEKGVEQRNAIHAVIGRLFGEDARTNSTINERKQLQEWLQSYWDTDDVVETKTRVKVFDSSSNAVTNQETETIMADSKVAVESRVFIFGQDAETVSDDQVFNRISTIENQIATLNKIENQPQKLKDKIAGMQSDIDALIKFVDAR